MQSPETAGLTLVLPTNQAGLNLKSRLDLSGCTCWALAAEPLGPLTPHNTAFCLFGLNHFALSFSLTCLSSPLFTFSFSIFPYICPPLSSPLLSPHLRLPFLSFPDHSKSFLTSEILFCSLLTPAGTYAAFSIYTHVYTNSVSDKA